MEKLTIYRLKKPLILASQSPRRQELLKQIGLNFKVQPSQFPEQESGRSPKQLALYNADGKAKEVAAQHPNSLIVGVDTIVVITDLDGQTHILGKPKSADHHRKMLQLLSASTHQVISGLVVIETNEHGQIVKTAEATEITTVFMDTLDLQTIEAYLASGEGEDKAAGYAIQGLGALFIKKIEGDYFNVVGLPLRKLGQILSEYY